MVLTQTPTGTDSSTVRLLSPSPFSTSRNRRSSTHPPFRITLSVHTARQTEVVGLKWS